MRSKIYYSRSTIRNKLYRFTLPLCLKDLPSSTYNLIHVHDATTSIASPKEWRSSTQDLNIKSLNEISEMVWHFMVLNEWYEISFQSLMIFNPQGVNREVFIGKSSKGFSFERVLNQICVKNLDRIYMTAQANSPTTWSTSGAWVVRTTWVVLSAWASHTAWVALPFSKSPILNHFKFKTKLILFIPQRSLNCHKLNLFKHTNDFSDGRTTTFDL